MVFRRIQSAWRLAWQFYRRDIRLWVLSNKWYIIMGATFMTYVAGFIGLMEYYDANHILKPLLDIVYGTFQLFWFRMPADVSSPNGWALQIARFAAPMLTLYLTAMLFMASFYVTMIRLSIMRNHAVICGMGYLGPVIAKNFYDWGYDTVVIEKDPTNNDLELCKDMGAIALVGDATKAGFLKRARAGKARFLFTVTGDDGINSEIAINCLNLAEPGRLDNFLNGVKRFTRDRLYAVKSKKLRRAGFRAHQALFAGHYRPLKCFVHVVDPRLCALLKAKEMEIESDRIKLEFFNIYETAGHSILRYPWPFVGHWERQRENSHEGHILVIGQGRMGESLIVHAAEEWESNFGVNKKLRITVVDRIATLKRDLLLLQNPGLDRSCEIIPRTMEFQSSEFLKGDFLFDAGNKCSISRIYICVDDESLGLSVALQLNNTLVKNGIAREEIKNIPIVVRTQRTDGLAVLLNKMRETEGIMDNIYAFPLVDVTCNADIVLSDVSDILARALHEEYVQYQQRIGNTPDKKSAMREWKELSDDFKYSNRDQASHIWRRLHERNYGVALMARREKPFRFTAEEIEALSEKEHERFVIERRRQGWKDGEYSEENKTSPYLIPYGQLEDEIKDYDRNFVRKLPDILAGIDLKIVKLNEGVCIPERTVVQKELAASIIVKS